MSERQMVIGALLAWVLIFWGLVRWMVQETVGLLMPIMIFMQNK